MNGIKILNTGYCTKYSIHNIFNTFPSLLSLTISSLGVGHHIHTHNINNFINGSLLTVKFEGKTISSDALDVFISHTTTLKNIVFQNIGVTQSHIIGMSYQWKDLTSITFDGINFTDMSFQPFKDTFHSFDEVAITGCPGVNFEDILTLLHHSPLSLQKLTLSRLDLIETDLVFLIDSFRNSTHFKIISSNKSLTLTDNLFVVIGRIGMNIKELTLKCKNAFTDDGILSLCEGGLGLQVLSLGECPLITRQSVVNIVQSF